MPVLARSVGLGPVFFPGQGRLGHRPVHRLPAPLDPVLLVVLHEPLLPKPPEDPSLRPALERPVGRAAVADAGGIQGIPLTAGAQHEEDRVHGAARIDRFAVAAQGMGLAGREQRLDAFPQFVRDAPAVIFHGIRLHRRVLRRGLPGEPAPEILLK